MLISKDLDESRKEKIENGKSRRCVAQTAESGERRIGACVRREEEANAETPRNSGGTCREQRGREGAAWQGCLTITTMDDSTEIH